MTPQMVTQWVTAIGALAGLGAQIARLVVLVRDSMSAEDADAVLRQLLDGWAAARAENEQRIAELQQQIGG